MQAICSKVGCEIELAIIMAECIKEELKKKEIKLFFEGECCALSYNDDEDWFDDEDEEFSFDYAGGNRWFEDALVAGLKEQEEMRWGAKGTRRDALERKSKDDDENKEKKHCSNKHIHTVVINIIFQ